MWLLQAAGSVQVFFPFGPLFLFLIDFILAVSPSSVAEKRIRKNYVFYAVWTMGLSIDLFSPPHHDLPWQSDMTLK